MLSRLSCMPINMSGSLWDRVLLLNLTRFSLSICLVGILNVHIMYMILMYIYHTNSIFRFNLFICLHVTKTIDEFFLSHFFSYFKSLLNNKNWTLSSDIL